MPNSYTMIEQDLFENPNQENYKFDSEQTKNSNSKYNKHQAFQSFLSK